MLRNAAFALSFVASFGSVGPTLAADVSKPAPVYHMGYLEGGVGSPLADRTPQGCPAQGKGTRNWLALLKELRERGYVVAENLVIE